MAGSWCLVQILLVCAFCHAVPQWSKSLQKAQPLMVQQTNQQFQPQKPVQQLTNQQFPLQKPVQQLTNQQFQLQKPVQQLTNQQFPLQKPVHQLTNQQFPLQKPVQQLTNQQFPLQKPVQQLTNQQFQLQKPVQQLTNQQFQLQKSVQQLTNQQFPLQKPVQQLTNQQFQPQKPVQQLTNQQFPLQKPVQQLTNQQFPLQKPVQQLTNQQFQPQKPVQQLTNQQFPLQKPVQQLTNQQFQLQKPVQQLTNQQFPLQKPVQQLTNQQFPLQKPVQQLTNQQFPLQKPVQQLSKPQIMKPVKQQFPKPVLQAEPFDKCVVADFEQIQCGPPGISGAECEAINCCFNGQQCFYGRAVTVQCIRDGQFVVVVSRDVILPRLSLDSVHLLGGNDPPCAPVGSTPSFIIYQFPVTACGTSVMEDGGYVVYENRMTSSYEVEIGPYGSITRDSHFEFLFQCRYSGTSVEALVVEVNSVPPPPPVAAPGPLRVELRLANGQCVTKGCAEGDEAYTSYYSDADYPITKVLREPVYVEVHIMERTDPNIVLMLGHCWTTSTPNPLSLPQWDLLIDGCPYRDDRYLTTLVPVTGSSGLQFPTHYKRFIVKMFTFVDPASLAALQETIFIHCSTEVCHPSSGSCEQSCTRKRRDSRIKAVSGEQTVVSSGEVTLVM
ncbi:zona pellucida sperm-binding protein 4-like [Carassius gibelio]|uniref:zona pellucida sperm-binding protein 4-like n=1 Tax=Carassius gibelio TaxID=101364 RepID=UPI0022777ECD|nr:zona pellucida sperm-binding protein 4-like [Carassius gibelio]XP_052436666.1 zona pellucida sperm-binding protein 4-like [Carassius gibelio]